GFQSHRFAKQTNLGMKSDVNQVGKAALLANRIHLSLRVGHQVRVADVQCGMHAVPTVIDYTSLATTSAAAGIGHGRTSDVHHRGNGDFGQSKDRFALRVTDVIVHHVAGAEHHRHAERAGGVESFVHARHDCIHAHGCCFAPMKI